MLVFRMYSNLYFLAGYIQQDVLIVLFGMIFSWWWYFLIYILFLSHISNSLPVFYACYNGRMSIVSTRYITFFVLLIDKITTMISYVSNLVYHGSGGAIIFFFSLPKTQR